MAIARLNYANIVLLPKSDGANSLSAFRPISLLNTTFKLITKVLANHLQNHMESLVGAEQSAFIQGRNILDCVAVTQEVISFCHSNNIPGVLLKLDFSKALDSVNWNFIIELLMHRGFPPKWCNWIKCILNSSLSSI